MITTQDTQVKTLLGAIFIVLTALLLTQLIPTTPESDSPEAGFARDMSTHHQQAVEMSLLVRDSTDNEAVRTLAYDILNTQATQLGMMRGWLDLWSVPQTVSGPPMRWIDSMPTTASSTMTDGRRMAGMATAGEMDRLAALSGQAAEQLFLGLMIAHHVGGVDMAEAVLARSDHPVVTRLAQTMVDGQEVEIQYMQELLSDY